MHPLILKALENVPESPCLLRERSSDGKQRTALCGETHPCPPGVQLRVQARTRNAIKDYAEPIHPSHNPLQLVPMRFETLPRWA